MSGKVLGTYYATTTETPMKTPLENISSRNLYCFVIIPIRSTCIMWLSYSATEQVGTVFLSAQRMTNLPSGVQVQGMLEIKLDTKLHYEPNRVFNHRPPSHFLCSLFKLPHPLYGRIFIAIESNRTLNLRGFIFHLYRT